MFNFLKKKILIKKLNQNAKIPVREHDTDAGIDLYCLEPFGIDTNEKLLIGTGIAVQIPKGYVGIIKEKSGISAKKGIQVMAGVIDEGYNGEVKVLLYKPQVKDGTIRDTFEAGEKIAQLVLQKVSYATVKEVESLKSSKRGMGGFGSTGTK